MKNLENTKPEQKEQPEYTPTGKEQNDIDYVIDFKRQCEQQTRRERIEWRKSLERYNLLRNVSLYEYIDDIHIGLTYDATERLTAALPGREFGFRGKPKGPEDVQSALLFSEALTQAWSSVDIMDGPTKMEVVKRSMALFGSCPVQLYWDTKFDSDGNLIKSDPGFYPINIFNFFANKYQSDIKDGEVGVVSEMTPNAFKASAEALGYKNWKKVKGVYSPKDSYSNSKYNDTQEEGVNTGDKLRTVRILEVQTPNKIITIALDNQPIWLANKENPIGRNNIVLFKYKSNPLPNRLYGISDIQRGGELEDSIQEAYNQMAFNHILVDNPMFTYNKMDRNIDPRTFVAAPSAGIPRGSDPNSLTSIQFNSHLGESRSIIQDMLERWKRVVNLPDIIAGVSDRGVQSASEANTLDANSKASFDSIVNGMKSSMYMMSKILIKMYEIYGPESMTLQIESPELIDKLGGTPQEAAQGIETEVEKEDFIVDRDVEVLVDFTTQSKAKLSNNVVQFLQLITKDEIIPPDLRIASYQQFLMLNDLTDLAGLFDSIVNKKQTSDTAMAEQENQKMMNGQQLPPTPGATQAHTQRHVEFMRSSESDQEVDRLLKSHIEGELAALQNEAQGGSPSQQGGEAPEAGIPQPTAEQSVA